MPKYVSLDRTFGSLADPTRRSILQFVSTGPASISEWGRFLPEHTTTASMLDRLLHHAVVVTEVESFRMREAKQWGGGR